MIPLMQGMGNIMIWGILFHRSRFYTNLRSKFPSTKLFIIYYMPYNTAYKIIYIRIALTQLMKKLSMIAVVRCQQCTP
jgi:hypothetical protein